MLSHFYINNVVIINVSSGPLCHTARLPENRVSVLITRQIFKPKLDPFAKPHEEINSGTSGLPISFAEKAMN